MEAEQTLVVRCKREATKAHSMRWYAAILGVIYLVFGCSLWLPAALMWRTGELWPVSLVVDYQRASKGLWASGLVQNENEYKRAVFSHVRPSIISLGSSRVLEIREDMFSETFVNMGRGMNLNDAYRELKSLLELHVPRYVIWGVDYWQLDEARERPVRRNNPLQSLVVSGKTSFDLIPHQTLAAWNLIFNGKISIADAMEALVHGSKYPGPRIGLQATTNNRGGFGPDGSYYNFHILKGPSVAEQAVQKDVRETIAAGTLFALPRKPKVSQVLLQEYRAVLNLLKRHDVTVITYLVPVATPLIESVQTKPDYEEFFEQTKEALSSAAAESGAEFYNYLNPEALGTSSSEFIDAVHPGDVVTSRLLLSLAGRNSRIASVLDLRALTELVDLNRGLPAKMDDPYYARLGASN